MCFTDWLKVFCQDYHQKILIINTIDLLKLGIKSNSPVQLEINGLIESFIVMSDVEIKIGTVLIYDNGMALLRMKSKNSM